MSRGFQGGMRGDCLENSREVIMETSAWGQLLCNTETKPPIRLMKDNITIGRTSHCDISFLSNKLISGRHCTLSRDENGKTWLTDISTNGTFLNGRKLRKNKKVELNHNDKLQLVKRQNQPTEDVVYTYQDLKPRLQDEEYNLLESTGEYSRTDDSSAQEINDETDSVDETNKDAEQAQGTKLVSSVKEKKMCPQTEQKHDDDKVQIKDEPKIQDNMRETLICSICQDIFHDCLSLQPCMHSFCSACYSEWMKRSKACPTCRLPIERMSRNHIVNNLVDAYLKDHPDKKRDAEELAEMDARNKITEDMIRPSKKRKLSPIVIYHDDDDDDDYLSDDLSEDNSTDNTAESDDEDTGVVFTSVVPGFSMGMPTSVGSLFGFTSSTPSRPPPVVCRWCPSSRQNETSSSASGSGSVREIRPGVPQPVCPSGSFHLLCLCCGKPMPKQENLLPPPGSIPYAKSQKCGICQNFYCNLLWKCDKPDCLGCLNEFKDIKFNSNCLDGVILNNKYESQILKNYLNDKGRNIQDLLSKCLEKLDTKTYTTTDLVMKPELSSIFILCYRCALKNLKELAFQFRRDIPNEELPAAVTSRPHCHWGKNCRTQTNPNNPHHASRYNHICEQTRFR
ncbi:E3 ubiquitin-protein ligase CHFR-like [Dendronephthya gigantea]|uniref:E3 ubiquitin-protein ligase CHFR-like n=1 Tax=Dendronephthya gigantea TaxID=151771 RepID=UPI0010693939|nr:E3 ubiquitin-protein ligase CHFR-like [Dendronephthya gigantea]